MSETTPNATSPPPASSPTLADALVSQGGGALDAELGRLREIVGGERRRAEALARWTKRVWIYLAVLVVLGMLSVFFYLSLSQAPSSYKPNASPDSHWPKAMDVLGMFLAGMFFLAMLAGPVLVVVAVVLTFLSYFARRTAGMHEMRASLASLEAQVRLLAGERKAHAETPRETAPPRGGST